MNVSLCGRQLAGDFPHVLFVPELIGIKPATRPGAVLLERNISDHGVSATSASSTPHISASALTTNAWSCL
ncbi:hypothetical protein PSCICN_33610 [Pseudomonas cichorii]|nr:hypothetical protein PSCICN_33610 [Pseudomonas cichorii]